MSSRVVSKRSFAVLLAILLAGVAAFTLFNYVQGVEAEVRADMDAVEAYVATDEIPEGMDASEAISQGLIAQEALPRQAVADNAIASLADIDGTVATASIAPGEQILAHRFGAVREATSRIHDIPDGLQAISLEVGVPPGVAGFVRPGDRVSILAQLDVDDDGEEEETRTQYLVQAVEVLAVGQHVVVSTDEGEQESDVRESEERILFTLAVTPDDAEKLAYANWQGSLWFTLLGDDDEPVTTSGRTAQTAFDE